MSEKSIGILDSGFGGLTTMRRICAVLPHENIVYFGDTARLPYGNKSPETLLRYCLENIRFLLEQDVKMVVIACHSACTAALERLRDAFSIPLIGISEPAITDTIAATKTGRIAVLGTRATIGSGVYQQRIAAQLPESVVTGIPCPLFVPLVEEGYSDHPIAAIVAKEYFRPLATSTIDAALLACTHYPILHPLIQRELGPNVFLIDPSLGCARETLQFLMRADLLNPSLAPPKYVFYVSDDPEKFRSLGQHFIHHPIENVSMSNPIFKS